MAESIQDNNYMLNDLAKGGNEVYPDEVVEIKKNQELVEITCKKGIKLRIYLIADQIFRLRYAPDGIFPNDFSYGIDERHDFKSKKIKFKDTETSFEIQSSKMICRIQKNDMRVTFLDLDGTVINEDEKGFHYEEDYDIGGFIVQNSKQVQSGEYYYGLGDKAHNLNLRGARFQNWGSDTYGYTKGSDPLYKNIPFYLGLHQKKGYGIFFDNSFRTHFDFGSERKNVSSYWANGGEMNYYFIYGPELLDVISDYTVLTGRPEMPPMWALGYHQCKWSYYPEAKVKEITKGFRDRKIPCDAIYLDIDYMDGFRCFTWDKNHFPEPKRMVDELMEDGFKTVVMIDPGIKVDPGYSVYDEGVENDYFCKRADGPLMKGSVWPGLCHFPDFTRPDVREWWAGLYKGLIQDVGVHGVWNDMNEPAVFEKGTFPDDVRFDYDGNPCSHKKAHNVYGSQMVRASHKGIEKFAPEKRVFLITRSAYAGAQRYCSGWTGDNIASYDHLWLANIQCQRLAASGMSFIGSDVGGFIETPDGELYLRWIQLAVFHPFFRTHSSGDHGEQEPWSYGEKYTRLVKKFIEFRYRMLPYMYTTFWQYVKKGTPMIRSLVYLDQNDPETHYRMAEFGLGDHMLVCPITQADVDGRWMYLPRGKWYYYWDDECYEGGMEVWANAPLNRIPLYIKAGAVIPMAPVMQYVGEKEIKELTLKAYFKDGEEQSTLYEDAGDGHQYKEGDKIEKTFVTKGSAQKFEITQTFEGTFEEEYGKYHLQLHGVPFDIKECLIDGKIEKNLRSISLNDQTVYSLECDKRFGTIVIRG